MSVWRYLLKLYKPRAGWLFIAFLSLTVTWLSAAALLAVSGWFITACAMAGLGLIVNLNIFTPSAVIRALAILRTVGRYAERVIGHEAILRILANLRVRSFAALASRPAQSIDERRYADLVNRLTADVDTLDGVPLRVIGPLFAAVLTWGAVVAIGAIWGGAAVALVIGAGGMLTFASAAWLASLGRKRGESVIQGRAEQRIALSDHFAGLADLLAYEKVNSSAEKLLELDVKQSNRVTSQELFASVSEHSVQALTALMTLLVLALTWSNLDAPLVALLALMTLGMNEALGTLPGAFWRIGESTEAGRRLMQLESISLKNTRESKAAAFAPTNTADRIGAIEVRELSCQRQANPAQQLNVRLARGMPLVIYGRSGTGKTSLLSTIAGELPPLEGQVICSEIDLLALPDHDRYQRIGFLSQNDQLLDVTIREFLCLGLKHADDQALSEALHCVDLLETLKNTAEGFDYRLGVGAARISGGQARRLQLASLLLRDPKLVLLDEPFRGLQPELVQTIIARTSAWLSRRCCMIVTHDPSSLPHEWPRLQWPSDSAWTKP